MQTLPRRLGVAVVTAVIVWFLSIKLDTFRDYQIAEVAIEVTAVAGLTVLTGLSGQISLGNGAFMAIGGYLGSKGSNLTSLVAFGILILVLMVRPDGLFSTTAVRRV